MNNRDCLSHRNTLFFDSLDRLMAGKETPEYVYYRAQKRKRMIKKLRGK